VLPRLAYSCCEAPSSCSPSSPAATAPRTSRSSSYATNSPSSAARLHDPSSNPPTGRRSPPSAASFPGPTGPVPRQARDAAALAPAAGQRGVDLSAAWTGASTPRPGGPAAHRPPRQGEPPPGYQRVQGELLRLGVRVSASAIRCTLRRHGLDPAPRRAATPCRAFLRQQAAGILACDLLHRRHDLPATAVCAVLHRTRHQAGGTWPG